MRTCILCGKYGDHKHHIFNGAKRDLSEKLKMYCYLCSSCHDEVHRNVELRLQLKARYQKEYMDRTGIDLDGWLKLFGRNYL